MLKRVAQLLFLFAGMLISPLCLRAAEAKVGVPVSYSLPAGGLLPKTYRVTLAIVDPKNPDWIISQFLAGEPRTVTQENAGRFTDYWDGLDDNFMPVPPGTYGVKGIFTPAQKWQVDGEYHVDCSPVGDRHFPLDSPARAVERPCAALLPGTQRAVPRTSGMSTWEPNGVAVFYYGYLENAANNVQVDLKKPIGHRAAPAAPTTPAAAGGGPCTCTDGESIWSFSIDGGPKFIYRADRKPFGARRRHKAPRYDFGRRLGAVDGGLSGPGGRQILCLRGGRRKNRRQQKGIGRILRKR